MCVTKETAGSILNAKIISLTLSSDTNNWLIIAKEMSRLNPSISEVGHLVTLTYSDFAQKRGSGGKVVGEAEAAG